MTENKKENIFQDIDDALLELSENKKTFKKIMESDYYNLNRYQFITLCVQDLWLNNVPHDKDQYTNVLFEALKKVKQTGKLV